VEDIVDLIHVSAGSYQFGFDVTHPSMFKDHGLNVYLAEEIKKHVSVPVATIGALSDPDQMEEILRSGKADIVYMARGMLADPEFANKVMANRADECIRCLRCYVCMAERPITQTRRCAINPRVGREHETMYIGPAQHSRKVMVAGGGIAGMVAAVTAADRGHSVVLCEKSDTLGGILLSEQALPFKYDMYLLGRSYALLMERKGVEVRLNTEVTAEYAEAEGADALIVAVGSEPIIPPLPGIDGEQIIIVNDYYLNKDAVGQKVVVLGGGLSGSECALHLRQEGRDVTLVEMREEMALDANIRNRPILLAELAKAEVAQRPSCRGVEITPEGLVCEDEAGNRQLLEADTVIIAVGQRPRSAAVDTLRDAAPFVRVIGDAVRASTITNAVYEGFYAALDV
ncbi:MAG: FAD-dependent oxidoreductase, partial [Coriobacteriales bacterium]|jgi:NADPH-dependent 2,4-dienoyl-CoA reductase/sulfur reductase-like enzyme|nr:FAD-dependent oxidoreductase [Coriobacteriales bacterium]